MIASFLALERKPKHLPSATTVKVFFSFNAKQLSSRSGQGIQAKPAKAHASCASVPLDALLLETDAPDQGLDPAEVMELQGDDGDVLDGLCPDGLNEPVTVHIALQKAAVLRQMTVDALAEACPQLKKIVNRIFEEIMVLGFISMIIFTMNTSGLMKRLHFKFDGDLSSSDRLHFYEFFHYIVFLTMIYFIIIVLLLLFIGTVVPKLLWQIRHNEVDSDSEEESENEDDDDDEYLWTNGKRDGSRAYALLLHRYEREGWTFRFNLKKQWQLWKSFEVLAFNICQNRSGYIYKNPQEMEKLFGGSRAYALLLHRYEREGWTFRFNLKKQWQLWKSFEVLAFNICQNRSGYIYKNPQEMEKLFGLHYHDHRFWFNSPLFLLRLFHFATIGQAFYLVWFTLVEWQSVLSTSLVLVLSLTGHRKL
ncbi:hypothetical protein P43SY_006077 [Pythium insidiosum]|uniref:Transmembrane protein n=1 Tax=Pythium insidiosum TaxID=114742 RepID=A0AAD5LIC2_PYTIN|nr:hypothetical protein P43SY_006077 [Pythium insidiosum]